MAAVLSAWLCTSAAAAKSKLLRIVHPGGHIELHDAPVRAEEIMLRNPKLCLAHSRSAHHPWAIVSPDSTLMLGCKYYLLPENTVGNLQKRQPLPPSPSKKIRDSESDCFIGGNCLMCFVSNEKGGEIVGSESEIGIVGRQNSESGEGLERQRVNWRGVFLQNGNFRGSPTKSFSWEPNLNSISEEY